MNEQNPQELYKQMTDHEMYDLLIEFYNSKFWPAYTRLTLVRMLLVEQGLVSMDPIKQGTEMARLQGQRFGMADAKTCIETEIKKRQEDKKPKEVSENKEPKVKS